LSRKKWQPNRKDFDFGRDYHKNLINGISDGTGDFVEINPWTVPSINGMNGITRTCQEKPDLTMSLAGNGAIIYDFYKQKNTEKS